MAKVTVRQHARMADYSALYCARRATASVVAAGSISLGLGCMKHTTGQCLSKDRGCAAYGGARAHAQ